MKHAYKPNPIALITFVTSLAALSTGCGKQAFQVTASSESQQAPGVFNVAPKVDILLVQDDTGSMREAHSQIKQKMPAFLQDLSSRGWDYHFAVAPLTTLRGLEQVTASAHDTNWGPAWTPPYPGVTRAQLTGQVDPGFFRLPEHFDAFLDGSEVNNTTSFEPGLKNIVAQLNHSSMGQSGFLRDDAMLAVVVVGNGNDTSDINTCTWPQGSQGQIVSGLCRDSLEASDRAACSTIGAQCDNTAATLESYKTQLKAVKNDPAKTRFYAAVAQARFIHGECLGSNTFIGDRYKKVASALSGATYDICNQPVHQILDSLAGNLQGVQLSLRTRYLVIAAQPKIETIRVYRHAGGNASSSDPIPQDALNGWTYAGYRTATHTIDYPALLNQATGHMIELHGAAKLTGGDTATVEFDPAGINDTVAN